MAERQRQAQCFFKISRPRINQDNPLTLMVAPLIAHH